jgi:hypothetical protein
MANSGFQCRRRGYKSLPIIGPTLSRNSRNASQPAAIGILTLIRSVWSTGLGLMRLT